MTLLHYSDTLLYHFPSISYYRKNQLLSVIYFYNNSKEELDFLELVSLQELWQTVIFSLMMSVGDSETKKKILFYF